MFATDGSGKATETHPTCGFAISPYLFIMVMEVASKLLEQAVSNPRRIFLTEKYIWNQAMAFINFTAYSP